MVIEIDLFFSGIENDLVLVFVSTLAWFMWGIELNMISV